MYMQVHVYVTRLDYIYVAAKSYRR